MPKSRSNDNKRAAGERLNPDGSTGPTIGGAIEAVKDFFTGGASGKIAEGGSATRGGGTNFNTRKQIDKLEKNKDL
jgi:hypothetical protein